jgi:glycosyltransferase involved in cell wall biosynthesis
VGQSALTRYPGPDHPPGGPKKAVVSATPRVSVVIPAYNAARYIRETLDSVLAQTYRSLEIIVVDDGSTDQTRDLVLAYGDRVRYVWQPNSGGCSSPRNYGLRLASGEIVAFLDSDDLIAPERIETAVAVLTRRPDVELVLTNFAPFDSKGVDPVDHFATCPLLAAHLEGRRKSADPVVLQPPVSTAILLVENFGSSAPIVRRAAVDAVGGFDETLPANEDFELNYRLAERYPLAIVPGVLMHKRRHDQNMSGDPERMFPAQILVRQKLLAAATDRRLRKSLRHTIGTYHLDLAYYYTGRDNRKALTHVLRGLRLGRLPRVRHIARIVADVAGRDTNGARHARASGMSAESGR